MQSKKLELEKDYPYLSTPLVELNKSQVFLSSINELCDDCNLYGIFHPATLTKGRQVGRQLDTKLGYHHLPTNGTGGEKWVCLKQVLEAETVY
jgi:hypothetical protein